MTLIALFPLSLCLASLAQPESFVELPFTMDQGSATLQYRVEGGDGVWQPLLVNGAIQSTEAGRNQVKLPAKQHVQVRAFSRSAYGPLTSCFFRDEGLVGVDTATQAALSGTQLHLTDRGIFAPTPLGWGLLLALLLAGPAGYLAYRRKHHALEVSESERKNEELSSQQLILPDGSLPKLIGPYRPLAILGSGAMGVVYKAEAPDKTLCAIKVPLPNLVASEEHRKRFIRELKLGMELKHPNLVQVLGLPVGEYPYIAMEWVQGPTLDRIERLNLPKEIERCRSWVVQILDALRYVHERKIWHRDLKPGNIMIVGGSKVKIMDFGIAQQMHGTRLTATDAVLGTPLYMAPEQLLAANPDARADFFALGAVLHERLAGKLPYSEDFVILMSEKCSTPLPNLHQLNLEIPPGVAEFVAGLTALSAQDRYRDAATAQEALARLWK